MTIYVSSRILGNGGAEVDTITVGGDSFPATGPNWARWVDAGSAGPTAAGAISPATGGEYSDKPGAVIDLSAAISMVIGRQVTQNQTFRVSHVSVVIENDDEGTNNDEGFAITGRLRYYSPTDHRVNAYQAYRKAWRAFYSGGGTTSMAFSTVGSLGEYKALRCGISDDYSNEQVAFGSTDPFSDVTGTNPNLEPIFQAYDGANAGDGAEYTNKLWLDGRTGHPESVIWSCQNISGKDSPSTMRNEGYHMNFHNPLRVMCGLLHFTVDSTQVDNLLSFDDEYHIRIGLGIDGYGGEF